VLAGALGQTLTANALQGFFYVQQVAGQPALQLCKPLREVVQLLLLGLALQARQRARRQIHRNRQALRLHGGSLQHGNLGEGLSPRGMRHGVNERRWQVLDGRAL
jgi:hypothetical protein